MQVPEGVEVAPGLDETPSNPFSELCLERSPSTPLITERLLEQGYPHEDVAFVVAQIDG